MKHCRDDYDAIQPWPTKRPHHAKDADGVLAMACDPDVAEPIIPDDEPVFILRAKDRTAPPLVKWWAAANEHDPVVAERVRRWAEEMERYASEHYDGGKMPDTPHELLRF